MQTFKQFLEACWPGYKRKKGTQEFTQGSCVKEDKMDALFKKHKFHMLLSKSSPNEDLKKQHNKKAYEYLQKRADIKGMKIPPLKEDGMAAVGAPANNVGGGNIAGSGGAGGEPGVSKKRNPVIKPMGRRNPPNM